MTDKIIYLTYVKDNILRKAALNEASYNNLKNDSSVTNIIIYTSELLMEHNYQLQKNNKVSNKKLLND